MLRLLASLLLIGASCPVAAIDLSETVTKLAGDDHRLIRWDASDETVELQAELCEAVLKDGIAAVVASKKKGSDTLIAMQALILCITDNPDNRKTFSKSKNVYKPVVAALKDKSNPAVVAAAGNLIWISVFGSPENHAGFLQAEAIDALATVVMTHTNPAAIMWAAAALQNLAASYCDHEENAPHCHWDRVEKGSLDVSITEHSGKVLIDAAEARKAMLATPGLVDQLIVLACEGPVPKEMSETNPYPGLNAVVKAGLEDATVAPHEESTNIIAWAATGALKNIALDPKAKELLEPHLLCICRLSQSYDWLESAKANDLIYFLRPSVPCWFNWEKEDVEPKTVNACIDQIFVNDKGLTCYDYEYGVDDEYCEHEDPKTKVKASTACCGCGGGSDHGIGYQRNGTTDEL